MVFLKRVTLIHRFFNGYHYGAKLAKPEIKVLERYTGTFVDPAVGKEFTLAAVSAGARS
jgi:basic membrane protein A and related proteins